MPEITSHLKSRDHVIKLAMISHRISGPPEFTFRYTEHDEIPYPAIPAIECKWDFDASRYDIVSLELKQKADGEPLSSPLLRQIPLGEILGIAVNQALSHFGSVHSAVASGKFADVIRAFQSAKHGLESGKMTGEKLEWIAAIYEMSSALGNRATQEVSEFFGVSLRTASNWVRQAREDNRLD